MMLSEGTVFTGITFDNYADAEILDRGVGPR
jgi:hypothetical protein